MITQDTNHNQTAGREGPKTPEARLTNFLETFLSGIGYELVAIEILNHREKILRVFIDLLKKKDETDGVSIEDCVKVTHELDQPLEGNTDVIAIFKGTYELEISSPGVDRPLRKTTDFERFKGTIARMNTFRPLTEEETQAPEYSAKNPKQKNFYGILRGFDNDSHSVLFGVIPEDGTLKQKKAKKGEKTPIKHETLIRVPLELIAKAHLEGETHELK